MIWSALYDSRMDVLERAEIKVALLKEAKILVGQLLENGSERDELLDKRNAVCKQLRESGASLEELQSTFGISRSRVQQILRPTS